MMVSTTARSSERCLPRLRWTATTRAPSTAASFAPPRTRRRPAAPHGPRCSTRRVPPTGRATSSSSPRPTWSPRATTPCPTTTFTCRTRTTPRTPAPARATWRTPHGWDAHAWCSRALTGTRWTWTCTSPTAWSSARGRSWLPPLPRPRRPVDNQSLMVQVLLIAAFVCLFLREMLAGPLLPGLDPGPVAAVYLGGQAAVGLATLGLVRWHERRLERVSPIASVARTDATALASRIAALVPHSVAVLGLGWLDVVRGWVGDLVLIDELIAVAPVMAVFVLGWWAVYPIDRRLREAVLIRDLDEGRPIHPDRKSV